MEKRYLLIETRAHGRQVMRYSERRRARGCGRPSISSLISCPSPPYVSLALSLSFSRYLSPPSHYPSCSRSHVPVIAFIDKCVDCDRSSIRRYSAYMAEFRARSPKPKSKFSTKSTAFRRSLCRPRHYSLVYPSLGLHRHQPEHPRERPPVGRSVRRERGEVRGAL